METTNMPKTYADCYLYQSMPAYNAVLFKGIMSDHFIDKGAKQFEDVKYAVNRSRAGYGINRVLVSDKTVLILPDDPLPKQFKVFVAKDARDKRKLKLFIDCKGIISEKTEAGRVSGYNVNESVLISYLVNGYTCMAYAVKGSRMLSSTMLKDAAECFAKLMTHIVDYLGRINTLDDAMDKCTYLSARYFLQGIMREDENRAKDLARNISGITEMKENSYEFLATKRSEDAFKELRNFVQMLNDIFRIDELTTNIVVEKWMYMYGVSTVFGLEFFPAFSAMLTDAYCGAYINNQKTIEKICGKAMVTYSKAIVNGSK